MDTARFDKLVSSFVTVRDSLDSLVVSHLSADFDGVDVVENVLLKGEKSVEFRLHSASGIYVVTVAKMRSLLKRPLKISVAVLESEGLRPAIDLLDNNDSVMAYRRALKDWSDRVSKI